MDGKVQVSRFTGKTLDEALQLAARQLQVKSPDELRYRVVEEKRGFSFIWPKVTIEAWIDRSEQESEDRAEDLCNRIAIEGLTIRVLDVGNGQTSPPVRIWSSPPVKLYVDGVEVPPGQAVEVTPGSNILADIGIDQTPSANVFVYISEDQLTASIEIEKHPVPAYKLGCEVTATGCRIVALEDGVIEPAPFTVDEVLEIIRSHGVQHQINEEAIRKAISGELTGRVVVAQGVPAVPTVQDRIEYKFETGVRKFDSDDVVDYYEFFVTPSVEAGAVIAELIQGHPGKPGVKVTGEPIPVEPYKPLKLEAGEGAQVAPDGKSIVATCGGRPVLVRNKVCVNRQYELNQGVGLHTSNVHFAGDVMVRGDVSENMLVEATGSIIVSGAGYECLLIAGEQLQVMKSLVGSHAIVGTSGGSLGKIYYGLRTILPQLEAVVESTRYMASPGEDSSRQDAAVRELIETRYRALIAGANELLKQVEGVGQPSEPFSRYSLQYIQFSVPEDVRSIVKLLATSLNRLDLLQWKHLNSILSTVEQVTQSLKDLLKSSFTAKIGYCQSSVVEADGDIQVVRQGSVNSTLRAGGDVYISGVTRGGEVTCLRHFKAKEVGTVSGTSTSISILDPQGSMKATIVHPNVQVTIGGVSYRFLDTCRLVEVTLGPQGNLKVVSAGKEI